MKSIVQFKRILWCTALGLMFNSLGAATIEGIVKLPAASPAPPVASRYKSLAVAKPEAPVAVVYLETKQPMPLATNSTTQLAQQGFQFVPGILIVQKGTTVEFPNRDPDYHNVFSLSKAKRFDLGRYRKEEAPAAQKFNDIGVIKLFCEIHEHMRGTIVVVDTPYFTRTEPTGAFKLENVPAGDYQLKIWFNDKTIVDKPITVRDDSPLKLDF